MAMTHVTGGFCSAFHGNNWRVIPRDIYHYAAKKTETTIFKVGSSQSMQQTMHMDLLIAILTGM